MRRRQLNFFPIFWRVFVVWWCLVLLLLFQCLLIVERAVWIMCMLFVLPVFSWLLDSQILNSIFEWKYNVLLFVQSKTVKKYGKIQTFHHRVESSFRISLSHPSSAWELYLLLIDTILALKLLITDTIFFLLYRTIIYKNILFNMMFIRVTILYIKIPRWV